MAYPSTSRLIVGDVQTNNEIWKQSLNTRQNDIQKQVHDVRQQVMHSPIISKREVTGRRLDKERIYNPITCTFNSPNATREDLSPASEGRKTYLSKSSSSIAGETPSWFSGTRRKYPSATQLSFEQKEKTHLPPSFGTATSRKMPTYFLGEHTLIQTSAEIERKQRKEEAKIIAKQESLKKMASHNPLNIDANKFPMEGLYKFDQFRKEGVNKNSMISEEHPDYLKTNQFIPQKKKIRQSPRGKLLATDQAIGRSISGDGPAFLVEQQKRVNSKIIREVTDEKKTWHNGGGGGIKSVFQTDYGQISDSTVSSDMPDFFYLQSKRICPDDVRDIPTEKRTWHNGGKVGVRSQFELDYGHISDSTVSGDAPAFLVNTNLRLCPEEVRHAENKHMKWHNRDPVQRQLQPHNRTNANIVSTSSHLNYSKNNLTATGALHLASEEDWSNRKTVSKDTYARQGGNNYVLMTKKSMSADRKMYADRGRGGYLKGSTAQVARGSSDALQIQKRKVPTGYLPARVDNGIF
jgi:hypothetical protein